MGESPLIKYMVARCATHFPVAYEATRVLGQGFEIAPLIHSGNQATKDRGLMRGQFPGAGFSVTSTRLQCGTHQSSAVWWGVVCSSLRLSRKILGNSRARCKILGVICQEFWENLGICIIRRHRSRVHQSRPENGVM